MRDHGLTGGPPPVETRAEPMTDIAFRSARQLATDIRRKKIGCLELLDHYLARVERYDPAINAVVVRDFERRGSAPARPTGRGPGQVWGPLHGVPMTVKESFDVAGLPTTWGMPALRTTSRRRTPSSSTACSAPAR